MEIIKFDQVDLIRGGKQILKNINWTVRAKENWAILGLNASGKSSLIKVILAEEWKTRGSLDVLGVRFGQDEIHQLRKRISVVGSFIAERFSSFIKAENLVYTGKFSSSMLYKPYSDAQLDEARELLRQIEAGQLIGRTYGSLSQGEKQLCLIARSLIINPEILILDEASNGLDLFAKEKLLRRLHAVTQLENPPALIYISHHLDEISEDFTHLLLLKKGQIFAAGEKDGLMTASVLTEFYDVPVDIEVFRNRYFVIPK